MVLLVFWRWKKRRECHGSIWCCQKTDRPMCNSWKDPHLLARLRFRYSPRRRRDRA